MQLGRLPRPRPDELAPDQRAIYDRLVGGPRNAVPRVIPLVDEEGRLNGPFNELLVIPEAASALEACGRALRYSSSLSARAREIATLEVARIHRSDYEWLAHEQAGLSAGLVATEIARLKAGSAVTTFSEDESAVRELARALATDRDLSDQEFAAASERFGQATVIELVALVGYYELLDLVLTVARTPMPEGFGRPFGTD